MRKIFLVALAALLACGCGKPPDRLVDGSGRVVSGRLEAIAGGEARFDGFSVPVPGGPASVLLRGGALYRGEVTMEGGVLEVSGAGVDASAGIRDVAAVTWGPVTVESLLLDVHASAGWTDTHLRLEPGSRVVLLSAGNSVVGTGTVDPEGLERTATTLSLSPGSPDGSLVGRIGEDGAPFTIGASWSGLSQGEGNLMLAVNAPSSAGASGFFTVSITVEGSGDDGHFAIFPAK